MYFNESLDLSDFILISSHPLLDAYRYILAVKGVVVSGIFRFLLNFSRLRGGMLDIFSITSYQKPVNGGGVVLWPGKLKMTSYGQWARPLTTAPPAFLGIWIIQKCVFKDF